ncbi:hypothetical protein Ppro_3685 (plasmid) [Pelobacter propionicus DSM 2379]|uniref:Uncharacterized protein n=1 Tax=Pelobacter propionicus (strain DSM 2379 / NBRC 103807 / OttBd1) TaxID=338966 RepID=A0R810_PELPD|nr:hypothetical protein Ppro_3685 [Pelobacter propionicus DSM 2379]
MRATTVIFQADGVNKMERDCSNEHSDLKSSFHSFQSFMELMIHNIFCYSPEGVVYALLILKQHQINEEHLLVLFS